MALAGSDKEFLQSWCWEVLFDERHDDASVNQQIDILLDRGEFRDDR
jgi:hypothetical protein